MVIKKKKQSTSEKRGKAKAGDLKLNKETIKDLNDAEAEKAKGGLCYQGLSGTAVQCPTTSTPCNQETCTCQTCANCPVPKTLLCQGKLI
jgi:hypothetical protein